MNTDLNGLPIDVVVVVVVVVVVIVVVVVVVVTVRDYGSADDNYSTTFYARHYRTGS